MRAKGLHARAGRGRAVLGLVRRCAGADLADPPDHAHRALRGRRRHRCLRPARSRSSSTGSSGSASSSRTAPARAARRARRPPPRPSRTATPSSWARPTTPSRRPIYPKLTYDIEKDFIPIAHDLAAAARRRRPPDRVPGENPRRADQAREGQPGEA